MTRSLNLLTKLILLFWSNLLLLYHLSFWEELFLVGFLAIIFLWEKDYKRTGLFVFLFALSMVLEFAWNSRSSWQVLLVGGRVLLPCFWIGSNILAAPVHELIHTLRRLYLPESVILALAVMVRFLPKIWADYKAIQQALILRGIILTPWDMIRRPLTYFEQVSMPLLMSASRSAQYLTIASLTKAVGARPDKKTSYRYYPFGVLDYVTLFVMILTTVAVFFGGF